MHELESNEILHLRSFPLCPICTIAPPLPLIYPGLPQLRARPATVPTVYIESSRGHEQKSQKYFEDAELTSMVCDADELSEEDEDTVKVGGVTDLLGRVEIIRLVSA